MTAAALAAQLGSRGVRLWVAGEAIESANEA
jgi:hypothetical protein